MAQLHRVVQVGFALALVTASGLVSSESSFAAAMHDARPAGQAPCSTGPPTFAYRGYCATFNDYNTYYGLYGLGFATPSGWGICSEAPATGGAYPRPGYDYVATGVPRGARATHLSAFGYSLSV